MRTEYVHALKPLLDRFGNDQRLAMILFTLDETTYSRELAPLAGHYPCLKLGPAWWFHDSPEGMLRFREQTTETAGFYNTVGFNDDTRAFLSIPARHDVARRVDCAFLAKLVAEHRLDEDDAVRGRLRPGLPATEAGLPALTPGRVSWSIRPRVECARDQEKGPIPETLRPAVPRNALHRASALKALTERIASVDARSIDELYGLEPVYEPSAPPGGRLTARGVRLRAVSLLRRAFRDPHRPDDERSGVRGGLSGLLPAYRDRHRARAERRAGGGQGSKDGLADCDCRRVNIQSLRAVLLVQSIEESDRGGDVLPLADRAEATRIGGARRPRGKPIPRQVATLSRPAGTSWPDRAEFLLARVRARSPAVDHVLAVAAGLTWLGESCWGWRPLRS